MAQWIISNKKDIKINIYCLREWESHLWEGASASFSIELSFIVLCFDDGLQNWNYEMKRALHLLILWKQEKVRTFWPFTRLQNCIKGQIARVGHSQFKEGQCWTAALNSQTLGQRLLIILLRELRVKSTNFKNV